MRSKILKSPAFVVVTLLLVSVGLIGYAIGLHEFIPRLRAESQSPGGEYTVKVYEKRLFPRPIFPRMGAVVKVYDRQSKLVYEKTIYHDDDWDDTVGNAYREIFFSGDEIKIGPGPYDPNKLFVIQKSELE